MRVGHWARMLVAALCGTSTMLLCSYWHQLTFHSPSHHHYQPQQPHPHQHHHNTTQRNQHYYPNIIFPSNLSKGDDRQIHLHRDVQRQEGHKHSLHRHTDNDLKRTVYVSKRTNHTHTNSDVSNFPKDAQKIWTVEEHGQVHDTRKQVRDKNKALHDTNTQTYYENSQRHDQNSHTAYTRRRAESSRHQAEIKFVQETEDGGHGEEEQGDGPPRVILLLASWRSGSTFLGELLATAVQDTFYSYEPLHQWKVNVLYDDDNTTQAAITLLKDLFHCRLERHPQQVSYMAHKHWYLRWNIRLASRCHYRQEKQGHKPEQEEQQYQEQKLEEEKQQQEVPYSCSNATFVSQVCYSSRLHVAKVLRLGLRWVVPLLEDQGLDLQVVYLVRDPRAVLSSRERVSWCSAPACRDPAFLCPHLHHDLLLLPHLRHLYPHRFKMVLYESLLEDVDTSLRELFNFLRLPVSERRLLLLLTSKHGSSLVASDQVSSHARGTYGTTRTLMYQARLWRFWTPYRKVAAYQVHCSDVIKMLGLRLFTSAKQYSIHRLPILLPRPHSFTS